MAVNDSTVNAFELIILKNQNDGWRVAGFWKPGTKIEVIILLNKKHLSRRKSAHSRQGLGRRC